MDGPMSGDIFPAKQAIEMIDQVDLSLPLEIPPVPADAVVTAIEDKTRRAASPRIMLSSTITTRTSRLRSPAILTGCAASSKSPEARMTGALLFAALLHRRPVTRLT